MPPVSTTNGGDLRRVTRCLEPVVDRGADRSAADRRLARAMMTGDQEQHAFVARDRLLQRAVDGTPRTVEAHPVKVDNAIGLDSAAAEAPVPIAVES